MSDRHFELPANPSLEYYRKQAKRLLHEFAAGDQEAAARVAETLGDRAAERFLLSDAQFVLAQEHGFRTWAEFRASIDSRTGDDRPVARLLGMSVSYFDSRADTLLAELHRNDPTALERLRTQVPRHADTSDASTLDLRDARLVLAREVGFPTWLDLVTHMEKAGRNQAELRQRWQQLEPELAALRAGDTGRLVGLSPDHANDLLHALALPEKVPGGQLGRELGVPLPAVAVLIEKATNLQVPLAHAARHNRVEFIRLLLEAGADPGVRHEAHTPLENAIYDGCTEAVDLLAEHGGLTPVTLWTYAACGRVDLVQGCFDAQGALRPGTASPRPDLMHLPGFATRRLTDDPDELLAEAFVHACQHGRTEVVRWFLDHGVPPNATSYHARTGLHWAIPGSHVEVVRLLLERGADPSIREGMFNADADGILHLALVTRPHHPTTKELDDLIAAHQPVDRG